MAAALGRRRPHRRRGPRARDGRRGAADRRLRLHPGPAGPPGRRRRPGDVPPASRCSAALAGLDDPRRSSPAWCWRGGPRSSATARSRPTRAAPSPKRPARLRVAVPPWRSATRVPAPSCGRTTPRCPPAASPQLATVLVPTGGTARRRPTTPDLTVQPDQTDGPTTRSGDRRARSRGRRRDRPVARDVERRRPARATTPGSSRSTSRSRPRRATTRPSRSTPPTTRRRTRSPSPWCGPTASEPADNTNEAYAAASCDNCAAVAVAFQVVLVVGDADVAVPQNLAVAVNYDCTSCLTYALAVQLFVTLDGPLERRRHRRARGAVAADRGVRRRTSRRCRSTRSRRS